MKLPFFSNQILNYERNKFMIFNCHPNGTNFINIFTACVASGKNPRNIKEDLEKGLKEAITVKMLLMNS